VMVTGTRPRGVLTGPRPGQVASGRSPPVAKPGPATRPVDTPVDTVVGSIAYLLSHHDSGGRARLRTAAPVTASVTASLAASAVRVLLAPRAPRDEVLERVDDLDLASLDVGGAFGLVEEVAGGGLDGG